MSKFKKLFIFLLFNFALGATHLNAILSHITVYQNQKGKKVILFGDCHDDSLLKQFTPYYTNRDTEMVTGLLKKTELYHPYSVGLVAEINNNHRLRYLDRNALLPTIHNLTLTKIKLKFADPRDESIGFAAIALPRVLNPQLTQEAREKTSNLIKPPLTYERFSSGIDDILSRIMEKIDKIDNKKAKRIIANYSEDISLLKSQLERQTQQVIRRNTIEIITKIADMAFLYSIMKNLQRLNTIVFIGGCTHTENIGKELKQLGFENMLQEETVIYRTISPTGEVVNYQTSPFTNLKIKRIFRQIRSIAFPDLPRYDDSCSNTCLLATAAVGAAGALTIPLLMYAFT